MGSGEIAAPLWPEKCAERYGFHPLEGDLTGEDMLFKVADNKCRGMAEDASRKILQDFRTGRMGPICLQLAPETEKDEGQKMVELQSTKQSSDEKDSSIDRLARAQAAVATAKLQGLELPPLVDSSDPEEAVGKGLFDGW